MPLATKQHKYSDAVCRMSDFPSGESHRAEYDAPATLVSLSLARTPKIYAISGQKVDCSGLPQGLAIIVAFSPTVFDRNVFAIHEPGFFQTLEEILQRELRQVVR